MEVLIIFHPNCQVRVKEEFRVVDYKNSVPSYEEKKKKLDVFG